MDAVDASGRRLNGVNERDVMTDGGWRMAVDGGPWGGRGVRSWWLNLAWSSPRASSCLPSSSWPPRPHIPRLCRPGLLTTNFSHPQQHALVRISRATRRSLIPPAAPRLDSRGAGHPAQGSAPDVQLLQGGGWAREALVVLRLFHGQLHRGASIATSCTSLQRRCLALLLQVRVKLRRLRYCTSAASSSVKARASLSRHPLCHRGLPAITMSPSHGPDRARKYKEEPAPGAAQKMVSCSLSVVVHPSIHHPTAHFSSTPALSHVHSLPVRPFEDESTALGRFPLLSPSLLASSLALFACCSSLCKPHPRTSCYPSSRAFLATWYAPSRQAALFCPCPSHLCALSSSCPPLCPPKHTKAPFCHPRRLQRNPCEGYELPPAQSWPAPLCVVNLARRRALLSLVVDSHPINQILTVLYPALERETLQRRHRLRGESL